MLMTGLQYAVDHGKPHLGGNVKAGDPYTYCPSVWTYVIDRFCVRSVLDLGSGCGNAAYFFHNAGLQVVAVDGLPDNVATSLYPAVLHDLTAGPVQTVVDLVHCQEVVEHVDEQFVDYVLASLLCGKIILMTHALPEQGGYHHVNLQPSSYWIKHLEQRGCSLLDADTARVRALANKDGATHMARSGLVFANGVRL
jgi:SAM-dependent methyltransferase